jgi:hypothetical protein
MCNREAGGKWLAKTLNLKASPSDWHPFRMKGHSVLPWKETEPYFIHESDCRIGELALLEKFDLGVIFTLFFLLILFFYSVDNARSMY